MTEYIKRSDAIMAITRAKLPDKTPEGVPIANGKRSVTDCVRRIKEIPAADVQPVRHGRWTKTIGENGVTSACRCNLCGFEDNRYSLFNYCPNCGAKMEMEDDEDGV